MTKYTRWLQSRTRLICVAAAMLLCVHSAQAQTPLVGGPGGNEFSASCPPGQLLGGVELRVGKWIDAIRPLCRTSSPDIERVASERYPYEPGLPRYIYRDVVTYPVSEAAPTTDWYGGPGGHIEFLSCDTTLSYFWGETEAQHYARVQASGIDRKVVTGIYVEAEGKNRVTVDRITLRCESFEQGNFYQEPSGGFRVPEAVPENELGRHYPTGWISDDESPTFEGPQDDNTLDERHELKGMSLCPVRQNGARTVATGIHGRAWVWLDALGLICEHPKKPATPIFAQGRVRPGGASAATAPPRAICDLARQARARNSPAAPGLEEKCRAAGPAGENAPVSAQGRVKLDPTDAPPAAPRAICDLARQARARNSPAAPGLEKSCRDAGAAGEKAPIKAQGRVRVVPAEPPAVQPPAAAGPTITASSNPVIVPNGQDAGTTNISWTALPGYAYSEIYLSVDDGEWTEFARGADASKPTTIKPGTTQTFRMMIYEGQAGTPKIVATLTVTARN